MMRFNKEMQEYMLRLLRADTRRQWFLYNLLCGIERSLN